MRIPEASGQTRDSRRNRLLELVVVAEQFGQELESNETIAIDVGGLVDIAHPTATRSAARGDTDRTVAPPPRPPSLPSCPRTFGPNRGWHSNTCTPVPGSERQPLAEQATSGLRRRCRSSVPDAGQALAGRQHDAHAARGPDQPLARSPRPRPNQGHPELDGTAVDKPPGLTRRTRRLKPVGSLDPLVLQSPRSALAIVARWSPTLEAQGANSERGRLALSIAVILLHRCARVVPRDAGRSARKLRA